MAQEDSVAELACETPFFMENVKTHRNPIRLVLVLLFASSFGSLYAQEKSPRLPNFDSRQTNRPKSPQLDATRESALNRLQARIAGIKVDLDEVLVSPKFIYNQLGFLSGPDSEDEILNPRTLQTLQQTKTNDPYAPIKLFLNENAELFGYEATTLDSARISKEFVTEHNGMRTVVWEQQLDGIPIFEAVLYGHITKSGELASLCSQFVPDPAKAADAGVPNRVAVQTTPPVSSREAVATAATNITETLRAEDVTAVDAVPEGAEQRRRFTATALLGDATASLVWLPMDRNTMRLCWRVILTGKTLGELYQVLVDAQTGDAQVRHCWTFRLQSATYRVFNSDSPSPFSPGHSSPNANQPTDISTPPPEFLSQVDMTLTSISSVASPNGWVNTDPNISQFVNTTLGNNVDSHTDLSGNGNPSWGDPLDFPNPPRPSGTLNNGALEFKFTVDLAQAPNQNSPARNQDAAVVNAFYWANWMHDKLYDLGFTEAAGNYQQNNFGRGGNPNPDAVLVDVQDSASTGKRNFSQFSIAPVDGTPGRLLLGLADGPLSAGYPERDAALDAEIICHEYTHGMVQRLVGHGAGISGIQTGQMNEGWASFYSLALLSQSTDDPNGNYAFAAYFFWLWPGFDSTNGGTGLPLQQNYYYGASTYPFSIQLSKNPYTFKDIDSTRASAHTGVPRNPSYKPYPASPPTDTQQGYVMAELWCVTLWEARANMITKYGFGAGNDLVLRLVTDGMKLGPPDPSFGQARDAILLADRVNTSGANQKLLWQAFAKRGMGWSAVFPPANTPPFAEDLPGYYPVEAFDLPPEGTQLWVYPPSGGLSGGVSSSPAVGPDGTIYFGVDWPEGNLYALNPTGSFKWSFPGRTGPSSFPSSPAIGPDGTIYVGCFDSRLYALDPNNGTEKWSYLTSGQVFSSPAIGPDGTIYFSAVDDLKVYALTPSGGLKWSRVTGNTVYSSPTVGPDGTVYVGSMDTKVYALDPNNGSDRPGWPYTTGNFVYSSPAVDASGVVYIGSYDGKVYALNPDGTKKWDYLTGDVVRSSPAIGPDGTVYVGSQNGKVYALDPGAGTPKAGWPFTTGSFVYSSPAVAADGTIIVASYDGRVYALNPDGTQKGSPWPFIPGTSLFSSPAIGTNGTIYVGCDNGRFYAIKNVSGLAQSPSPMFRRNLKHTAYDWYPVGVGVQAGKSVFSLSVGAGNVLYAGGSFVLAGNLLANRIAQWNGAAWSAVGSGLSDGFAASTATSGSALYVGGLFNTAGGFAGPNIAKWTGSAWTTLLGPNGAVYALAVAANGDVYIGGSFTTVNSTPANNIARLRSGAWQALGSGVNGPVHALAIDSLGQVYVGGSFSVAGAVNCANIAKWADPNWSALGNGTDGDVAALAIGSNGLDVYSGGYFRQIHNGVSWVTANGIAKWASGAWSVLGTGLQALQQDETGQFIPVPAHVNALAVSGSTLYTGGDFTLAGGIGANRIATWNGTSWSPLGSGAKDIIYAVALTSDYLYAGGQFTSAGGAPAYGIARWKR